MLANRMNKLSGIKRTKALGGKFLSSRIKGMPQPAEPLLPSASAWPVALEALSEPIWLMDTEGRILQCNQAARRMFGEDLVGRRCQEAVCGLQETAQNCPLPGMCQGRRRECTEMCVGSKCYQVTVDPLFDQSGKVSGAVHVMRDITADVARRTRLTEAMEQERQLLRTLIDLLPDFIFVKDAQGRFLIVNQSLARAYGRSVPELISRTDADFMPRKIAANCRAGELKVLAGNVVAALEDTLCFPDGQTRTVVTNMAAFRDVKGVVCGVVGIGRDVTRSKQAEEALRLSETKYARAFANNPAAIALTRLQDGRFLEVNDTWVALSGFSREAVIGRSARSMGIWPDPGAAKRFVREVRKRGVVRGWEQEFRKKSGEVYVVELSAHLLNFGGVKAVLSTLVDITARKRAERMLQQANRMLQAIRDCHEALLRADTEGKLLAAVCQIIVQIGGERMAWVGFAEHDARKTVRPVAVAGSLRDYLTNARITWAHTVRGRGPVGTAIRTGKVCICHNTLADRRFAPWREAARRQGYGSVIALPLIIEKKCLGALCLYAPEPGAFDVGEQMLLTDLANDLAFGISMLRLRAERRRLEDELLKSTEREQERIGRDIHDGLCQLLVGAKYRSVYLRRIAQGHFPAMEKEARSLEELLNDAIRQARDLARGLNPIKIAPDGLTAALQKLAADVDSAQPPRCFCHIPEPVRIGDLHVAYHLYRITQEAVQNALKHARAKNISITLSKHQNLVRLTVKDDGVGLPRALKTAGMGLKNMAARARLMGGRLEIRRRTHGGTAVTCELLPPSESCHET